MIAKFRLHAQDGVDFITIVTNIAPGYDHNTATIGNKYREKHKTPILRYQEAKVLRQLTSAYHALLIIDDYVDLALAVHADGIIIGQDDLVPNTVRRIVESDMLIGWSTHSINDLKCANRYQNIIDYIGGGPVFATQTKPNAHPVGISCVHWAKQYSKLPIVAIGGIKISNVESIWKVHPDFICAVSELNESQDMHNTVYELMSGYSKVR